MTNGGKCWGALLWFAAVAAIFLWAESAAARDESLEPEPPAAELPEPAAPAGAPAGFDVGFGTAFTSDYVSRGITQSDSKPAVQGYIEPSFFNGEAYLNIWSSMSTLAMTFEAQRSTSPVESDRNLGDLSLNLGYVHYFYAPESVSPDYGEFFGKADYNVTDKFIVGTRVLFAPDFSQTGKTATFVVGGAKVLLTKNFSAYGGVEYQFFEDPHAFEDLRLDRRGLLRLEVTIRSMSAIGTRTSPTKSASFGAALRMAVTRGSSGLSPWILRGPS